MQAKWRSPPPHAPKSGRPNSANDTDLRMARDGAAVLQASGHNAGLWPPLLEKLLPNPSAESSSMSAWVEVLLALPGRLPERARSPQTSGFSRRPCWGVHPGVGPMPLIGPERP